MFRCFFMNRAWQHWSVLGSIAILLVTWFQVQLDVKINEWFGEFYNAIQQALGNPGQVSVEKLLGYLVTFAKIAGVYIVIAVLLEFYVQHYVFRWRTAMNNYYMQHWEQLRHIEGAAQRVQEDTMRFARIMESLGVSFLRSIMTLFAFLPLLWVLSKDFTTIPWFGEVDHALVYLALISAAIGTVLLALVGIKLPGLEFNNQRVEAAYRKELVHGEDDKYRAKPPEINQLFAYVRKNYFTLYLHYMYFGVAKWSYLQFAVIFPYIVMAPTIVAGAVTLGVMQQVVRAFGKVEDSFQFLVHSWSTIIELISIYKRLHAFESTIKINSMILTNS